MSIRWVISTGAYEHQFLALVAGSKVQLAPIFTSHDKDEILASEVAAIKGNVAEYFRKHPPSKLLLDLLAELRFVEREHEARQQQSISAGDQLAAARRERNDLLDRKVSGSGLDVAERQLSQVGSEVSMCASRLRETQEMLDDCKRRLDGELAPALHFAGKMQAEVSAQASKELVAVASAALTRKRVSEGAIVRLRLSGNGLRLAVETLQAAVPPQVQEGIA